MISLVHPQLLLPQIDKADILMIQSFQIASNSLFRNHYLYNGDLS
jgi:hypothetical protein